MSKSVKLDRDKIKSDTETEMFKKKVPYYETN